MLTKISKQQFCKVYDIMKASFPPDELRPYNEQLALLDKPPYSIYTLSQNPAESIDNFVAIWEFDSFIFIEHIAVCESLRGSGTGSKILGIVATTFDKIICLEVEPPTDEMSKRQIEFYKRNGYTLNPYPYIQPSISKGKNEIELMIMSNNGMLTQNEFDNFKDTVYKTVYNVK